MAGVIGFLLFAGGAPCLAAKHPMAAPGVTTLTNPDMKFTDTRPWPPGAYATLESREQLVRDTARHRNELNAGK